MIRTTLIAAALGALTSHAAVAGDQCDDFQGQPADASYGVGQAVPIGIGEVRVRPLRADGQPVATNPANTFLRVIDQQIAGGAAPEMYGKNVAVQMRPREGVASISLKVSHQPGADGQRAAFVEVNGVRHEFRGSLAALAGKTIGAGQHPARFEVDVAPVGDSNWVSGRLRVSAQDGVRSFTLGAAELRLDDVCFRR